MTATEDINRYVGARLKRLCRTERGAISVGSSSAARELFTRFGTGERCRTSFGAGCGFQLGRKVDTMSPCRACAPAWRRWKAARKAGRGRVDALKAASRYPDSRD
jgi:hypothetical protein